MVQKIRVEAILMEEGKILLVQQQISESCRWSLPGGTLKAGESIEQGIKREVKEETGLDIVIDKLLYIGDRIEDEVHTVQITFLVRRISGVLQSGYESEVGANPIVGIKMVPICSIKEYGFGQKFFNLALQGFPYEANYIGSLKKIGL